jgi:hypothetical protein
VEFRVFYSFFVVVRLTLVNLEFRYHRAYCEISLLTIFGESVGFQILWNKYKVRLVDVSNPLV